jgi:GcrA cell cycle regulator
LRPGYRAATALSDFWGQGSRVGKTFVTNEDQLKAWCIAGKTSGEVEALFAFAVTRSAIIGKAMRRGFKWANNAGGQARRARDPIHRVARATKVMTEAPPIEEPMNGLEIEPGVFVGILAINDRMCRWPIGDPLDVRDTEKFHYCGRPPLTGAKYCEAHERKAHQPSKRHRQLAV